MMFGSLDGVKRWLPEVQGDVFDVELSALLVSASIAAEVELSKVCDPDALPSEVKTKVDDVVEMLAAGYFRLRRQKGTPEYIDEARKRLDSLVQGLKTGVYAV